MKSNKTLIYITFLFLILIGIGSVNATTYQIAKTYTQTDFTNGTLQNGTTTNGISLINNESSKYISTNIKNEYNLSWDSIGVDYTKDSNVNITYNVRTFNDLNIFNNESFMMWDMLSNDSYPIGKQFNMINASLKNNFIDNSSALCINSSVFNTNVNNLTTINTSFSNITIIDYWLKQNNRFNDQFVINSFVARNYSFRIKSVSGYEVDMWIYDSASSSTSNFPALSTMNRFNDGDWHFFRLINTWNGTKTKTDLWIDGMYIGTNSASTMGPIGNINSMVLGHNDYCIKGLKFYNKSISENLTDWKDDFKPNGNGIPVISSHKIYNSTFGVVDSYSWNASKLEEVLGWLNSSGYESVTVEQFYLSTKGQYTLPKKAFVWTFDDGANTEYMVAYPIFKKYNYIATVGVTTEWINTAGFMTSAQVLDLYTNGWEIASHSLNHSSMLLENYSQRQKIFNESKEWIYNLTKHQPITFFYPGSSHNSSIDIECSNYYANCFVNNGGILENRGGANMGFNYPYFNMTKDSIRVFIDSNTTVRAVQEYIIYGGVSQRSIEKALLSPNITEWINTLNTSASNLNYIIGIYRTNNTQQNNITKVFVIAKSEDVNKPLINSYSKNITSLNATYDDSLKLVNLTCSGTGSITINNLNLIKGSHGYYEHIVNGVHEGYYNANTIILSSCSEHIFKTSEYTGLTPSGIPCPTDQESAMLTLLKIVYLIVVMLFLIGGIYLFKNDVIGTEGMIFFVVGTIVLIVFMPVIFNLINNSLC